MKKEIPKNRTNIPFIVNDNAMIEIEKDEIKYEDLEFINELGTGTYGRVCLYKTKTNPIKRFALKFFYEDEAKRIKAERNYNKEVKIIRKK